MVYELILRGDITPIRIGRAVRIEATAVDKLIETWGLQRRRTVNLCPCSVPGGISLVFDRLLTLDETHGSAGTFSPRCACFGCDSLPLAASRLRLSRCLRSRFTPTEETSNSELRPVTPPAQRPASVGASSRSTKAGTNGVSRNPRLPTSGAMVGPTASALSVVPCLA
jgi:hypothetical protein